MAGKIDKGLVGPIMDGEKLEEFLDEVTFVVTVRERCKHLRRALDYYANFPIRVVVMDSSDRPCGIDKHPTEFRHLHLPQTFLVDAISTTLVEVTTPYCVIVSDDDFILPLSAAALVRFLKANPDYQCAQGLYGFFKNDGEVKLWESYPHMPGYEVALDTPQERMVRHLSHYVTHYHAVHRTENLRAAISGGRLLSNFSANEIVTGALNAMAGKFKVLPMLYCVREVILTSQSSLLQQEVGNVKFAAALSDPQAHRELIKTCETVLRESLEARGVPAQAAVTSIHEAFEAYNNFAGDFKERVVQWQEKVRRDGAPTFVDVLADHDVQNDWALIESIVKNHDLSPIVPPLLVDNTGRTIRKWSNSPGLFRIVVGIRNWSGTSTLSRIKSGIRSLLGKSEIL